MQALGLAALLLSLVMIFLPVMGAYGTPLPGLMAAMAFGRGFTMGMAALLINLVNVLFLSPILWLSKNAGLEHDDLTPMLVLIGLAVFQVVCGVVLILLHRRRSRRLTHSIGDAP